MTIHVFAVVEDDADTRVMVRTLFSQDDRFSLTMEVASAEEAIQVLRAIRTTPTLPPDLLVVDHNLDGAMTGLEAAPLMKREVPQTKIILFTGSEEVESLARAEEAVDGFVLKSHADELIPTARRLLGLDRPRSESTV